jgi:hypothetical protein
MEKQRKHVSWKLMKAEERGRKSTKMHRRRLRTVRTTMCSTTECGSAGDLSSPATAKGPPASARTSTAQGRPSFFSRHVLSNQSYLLHLALFSRPQPSCQPQCREQQESYARAHRSDVVWPCRTQEARVLVMTRWDDSHSR